MISQEVERSFFRLVDTVHGDSDLEPPVMALVLLAASMAIGCEVCISRHMKLAREQGLSEAQIGAVAGAVMIVAAGAVRNKCLGALGTDRQ